MLAGIAGFNHGATPLEAIIWCAAGVALSLCSLAGVSATLTVHGFVRKSLAALVYMFGVTFTGISGLGSINCGRELSVATSTALTSERDRLTTQYDRANDALKQLPSARPVSVVQTEIDALLKENHISECSAWLTNVKLRAVCIEQVAPLQKEFATATERSRLKAELNSTSTALNSLTIAKPANTDATSVQRYLEALGIHIEAQRLVDLINFLTVAAIEIAGGATLAIAQRQNVPVPTKQSGRELAGQRNSNTIGNATEFESYSVPNSVPNSVPIEGAKKGPKVRSDVLDWIQSHRSQYGRLPTGAAIASQFGLPISTAFSYRQRAATSNVVPMVRSSVAG
jgi:hypothetical protein